MLTAIADELQRSVRSSDLVERHGGDEFVVIAPQTCESHPCALARRLRTRIREASVAIDEPVDASIGVAQWIPDGSAEQLPRRSTGRY